MASVAIVFKGIDLSMPTLRLEVSRKIEFFASISTIVGVGSRFCVRQFLSSPCLLNFTSWILETILGLRLAKPLF